MQEISMKDLFEKAGHLGKDEIVLDVRSREEYKEGHVAGSKNIPHDEVLKHLSELKQHKRIFVHCHAGGRAQMAFDLLQRAGLKNLVCVAGSGMKDWIASGYPVER